MGSGGSTAPQCSSSAELMLSCPMQVYVVEQEPPQYYVGLYSSYLHGALVS